ncbi:MAG: hypothetical protein NWT08_10610 [Akkermansiaceae bacterium]|jgi:hypothetical protein|nr:hypothetical protein [Akkermansiaceae bacterium]MDP4647284.1 hypothetical protein [Akkermansiaceae bacterium]MDP4721559.1 hypothetical protein [Akkermansiaceae bacterium]MDP4781064.1 hypothetical protein [Akkermansiaceae bacterium]MDP4847500.1 hypothetical protein [Akkermansiaceae bacterium]
MGELRKPVGLAVVPRSSGDAGKVAELKKVMFTTWEEIERGAERVVAGG